MDCLDSPVWVAHAGEHDARGRLLVRWQGQGSFLKGSSRKASGEASRHMSRAATGPSLGSRWPGDVWGQGGEKTAGHRAGARESTRRLALPIWRGRHAVQCLGGRGAGLATPRAETGGACLQQVTGGQARASSC